MENERTYEEQAISIGDIFSVLFGRWKLFLILLTAILVCGFGGTLFIDKLTENYVAYYEYSSKQLNLNEGAKYFNGFRFDLNDLVTKEKLNEYKSQSNLLSNIDMEEVYNGSQVRLENHITYKTNPVSSDEKADKVLDYQGYKITVSKGTFNKDQAKEIASLIATEANKLALSYSVTAKEKKTYSVLLDSYEESNAFENKIEYLKEEFEYLTNSETGKYNQLIKYYGDVYLSDGRRISDVLKKAKETFKDKNFDDLSYGLRTKGYVYNEDSSNDYKETLRNRYKNLNEEVMLDESKVDSLKEKIEFYSTFIGTGSTGSTVQNLDLLPFNTELASLTIEIEDKKYEMKNILKLLHQTYDSVSDTWTDDLTKPTDEENDAFENLVDSFKEKLVNLVDEYIEVEKEVVESYSKVVFKSNSVVKAENEEFNAKTFYIVTIVCAIFVPMIVNLCIDGKKIFKTTINKEEVDNKNNKQTV